MVDVKQALHIPWSKHSANKELTQKEVITLIAHHNNVTYEEAETRLNQQGFFDKLTGEQSGDVIEHVHKRMELQHTEDTKNDEEKYLEEFSDELCSALQRGGWDDVVYHLEETISMTPLSGSNEKDIKRAIKNAVAQSNNSLLGCGKLELRKIVWGFVEAKLKKEAAA